MVDFVGLAVHLVVWTPLLTLTLGRVGISQFVQKKKPKTKQQCGRKKQTNTDLELQNLGDEVWHF